MEFSWFEFVGYRVLPERLSDFSVLKRIMRAAQKKKTWLRECILRRDTCYFYLFFLSFEQRISSTGSKPQWLKSGIVLSYETCLSSFHRLCQAFHFFFFFVFFYDCFPRKRAWNQRFIAEDINDLQELPGVNRSHWGWSLRKNVTSAQNCEVYSKKSVCRLLSFVWIIT